MDKREGALREALTNNAEETERWVRYQQENETAIENLERFSKHLVVEVMVPVGKKAFIPGQLVHTNEILVGHYQGYFSKCSAHKAKEICERRIKMAQEQLKQLATESDLWQNKLDIPYLEGVLPSANGEEREIIEPYDDEAEKHWRVKHMERIKQAKDVEKFERQNMSVKQDNAGTGEKTNEEIFNMLEEAELMEELEKELDSLEVDEINDETIKKLMSGEIKLPEKQRISYNAVKKQQFTSAENNTLQGVVKRAELNSKLNNIPRTNNNFRTNPEITASVVNGQSDESDDSESDIDRLPEVQLIKEQATFLPLADQIGFYEYQIQIVKEKILIVPLKSQDDINEKIRLHQVLEELEELLEIVEEAIGVGMLAREEEEEAKRNAESDQNTEPVKQQKRRISFASEDQTLEFNKHQTVKQMLANRDIITLDEPFLSTNVKKEHEQDKPIVVDKKQSILDRVEQNRKYVIENQSKSDFDLVNKILDTSLDREKTLHIHFKHSPQMGFNNEQDSQKLFEIGDDGTPADFYLMYLKTLQQQEVKTTTPTTIFLNGYDGEEEVKAPILREAERELAYVDPRMEFLKAEKMAKSILRNKEAVKNEKHTDTNLKNKVNNNNKKKKKNTTPKDNIDELLTIYDKVVSDVVEKPLTEPEPLPEGKYIDAHTPKKRVSRFKQMRSGAQKT